ncbi:MAG: hypothetical protein DWQ36_05220 [Acidobacteria bacterium]|nr:MAG: hypothetical protein DWQ30_10300 [Acidobacteriota bacterium]REK10178.1 MAG: hypothetical protein DWQ36_05220 [Acidobacteriota bacterium]
MDNQRFREAYMRLQRLDEGQTYKLRDRGRSISRQSTEQLEDKVQELSRYTLELKEILQELFLAIGTPARKAASDEAAAPPPGDA